MLCARPPRGLGWCLGAGGLNGHSDESLPTPSCRFLRNRFSRGKGDLDSRSVGTDTGTDRPFTQWTLTFVGLDPFFSPFCLESKNICASGTRITKTTRRQKHRPFLEPQVTRCTSPTSPSPNSAKALQGVDEFVPLVGESRCRNSVRAQIRVKYVLEEIWSVVGVSVPVQQSQVWGTSGSLLDPPGSSVGRPLPDLEVPVSLGVPRRCDVKGDPPLPLSLVDTNL